MSILIMSEMSLTNTFSIRYAKLEERFNSVMIGTASHQAMTVPTKLVNHLERA